MISKYKISGNSMSPALKPGHIVLVNRLSYLFSNPKIGDIIALKNPDNKKILIKRIFRQRRISLRETKYFVVGDNKTHSTDSRSFGWIGKKYIIGKVIFVKSIKGTTGIKGIKGE